MNRTDTTPLPDRASASSRRTVLWRVLLIVLLSLGIPLIPHLISRFNTDRAARAAAAAVEELDPEWTWEQMQGRRPALPDEENGALRVIAAFRLLPRGQWPAWNDPDALHELGLDESDATTLEECLVPAEPCRRLDTKHLNLIRSEVERAGPALTAALKLTDYPRGRYPIRWQANYLGTRLEEVHQSRAVAALLGYAALVRTHDGDMKGACACIRAGMHTARTADAEPCLIAYWVRVANMRAALSGLERALALGRPDAADLVPLQALLRKEDEEEPALCLTAVRGERAGVHKMFAAYEKGEVSYAELLRLAEMDPSWAWLPESYAVPVIRRTHAAYLRHMTEMIEAAKVSAAEQPTRFRQAVEALKEDEKAAFARLLVPDVAKMATIRLRRQTELRCALAAVAAERYRQEKGQWPDALGSLVPRYLAKVPVDPFDEAPLRMRRLADGVVVYSVGPDRADNGGTIIRRGREEVGSDVGFQLWDGAKRGREVGPK